MLEAMQEIAAKMTEQGCPVTPLFRNGLVDSASRLADGDPVKLEQHEKRLEVFLPGVDGVVGSHWRVKNQLPEELSRLDNQLIREGWVKTWQSYDVPLQSMPIEMIRTISGVRLYQREAELYYAALLARNEEWLTHYAAGNSLWEKISERYDRPRSQNLRRLFFMYLCSGTGAAGPRALPWLQDVIESYAELPQGRCLTPFNSSAPRSSLPNRKKGTFWSVVMNSAKEAVTVGVVGAYKECGIAPHMIHHDGAVVPHEVSDVYAKHLSAHVQLITEEGSPRTPELSRFQKMATLFA
jgi:hypothetical protein